ncbi:hypothetical protein RUMOBE_03234 [Blautia obeum ATCC 29174]|uniref:Uncharacterized protein n=1 Tax=Blautia obeum ATCC 29174 TaxID=411459 RepID=A5ZW42_9FIRM|nr:hypothetical protein RUMOBE_03234 [Blautia obeum ATCC 29174]
MVLELMDKPPDFGNMVCCRCRSDLTLILYILLQFE